MLVLVGKMCSGKSTIRNILIDEFGMDGVVTCTTRPPRKGETNGKDYRFMKRKEFKRKKDEFAEITSYHVATGDEWCYGSLKTDYEDSDDKVIILNPEGLKAVRNQDIPVYAVQIFVTNDVIAERAKRRGDNEREVQRRIRADARDFGDIVEYIDVNVPNGDFRSAKETAQIIYDEYQNWLLQREVGNAQD